MAKINQAMQDLFRYNAAILPQKRSSFDKSHSHTTTFDSAYLVPIMWDRVVPGDEKKIRYSGLARMTTPKVPVMDQANLDVWAFYVPDRLWWTNAKKFYGENLDASFNPDGEYVMPYLKPSQYMVTLSSSIEDGTGSLNDYFGFPVGNVPDVYDDHQEFYASAGLHRSYQLIWNEWFRNSSVQPALQLNDGDNVTGEEWSVIKQIRKVNKYPDYFTSLLREPQAGDDVTLPLGEWAPVVTRTEMHDGAAEASLYLKGIGADPYTSAENYLRIANFAGKVESDEALAISPANNSAGIGVEPINLWADLTSASAATINNLRAAITVQQLLEIDATAGKRYQQLISAHFGTFVPDATLQRPELLGATRTTIGMRQVLQTAPSTDGQTALGDTAAFSVTNVDNEWICNKSFTEPGFIMVLAAVRVAQSYSQGLDPLLTKLHRYDHYYPVFDNLGNQPVPVSAITFSNSDLYDVGIIANHAPDDFKQTFGYAEAWTEYRVKQNRVSGLMRPDVNENLSVWNYSSLFHDIPVLNSDFIQEDDSLIDRTIAFQDEPQFLLDSYFEYYDTKNMSVHSIPGLLRL